METQCIFASSKYYRQAYADALRISQPLGYNFLSKKQQAPIKKQTGPLIRKLMFEKPLVKPISTKLTPQQKVNEYLLVSDSKRKNTYLSANPLSIINRTSDDICQELSTKYLTDFEKQKMQTLDFVNALNCISDDVLFSINDYALSTYLIFYFGKNSNIKKLARHIYEEQFLQYEVKTVGSFSLQNEETQTQSNNSGIIQFDESHIKNKEKIDEFIEKIHQAGNKIDRMYSGMHLFIGDCISFVSTHEILKQEIDNLKYLQFYLYLITSGILGNGQNALIKIRGTMRHKTIDYLFLFKLIFSKVSLIKPAFSNFLSSEKYMFCEGYSSQNGNEIHKFISENFNLLAEHGEEKLLVNPQLIFRQEALADNTKNFNDSLIVRGLKEILDVFLKNNNLEIYPPKTVLMEKLQALSFKDQLTEIIDSIEKLPNEQEIKQANEDGSNGIGRNLKELKQLEAKPIVEEKQASLDIFQLLKKAKQQAKPAPKPANPAKPKVDDNDEIQGRLLERFKQQERIREEKKKIKKENDKKNKQKKEQDQYLYSGSRFDMAEE